MSVSLWAWTPQCDGKPCCGDCDLCGYERKRGRVMRIPRYIVIKLEMAGEDTVKATEITDRCEIYEYEADEDEPQTERSDT